MLETRAKLIIKYNEQSKDPSIRMMVELLKTGIRLNDMAGLDACISTYNEYVRELWKKEMTNPKEYKEGESFKFAVHNLTKDDFYDEFATELVSGLLITNKIMGQCGKSNVGFILAPHNMEAAMPYDLYTNNDYYKKSFYYEDYKNRDYSKAFPKPAIMLPSEVLENEMVTKTIVENGEILNYDKKSVFPEMVFTSWLPTAIYTVTNGEKEINPDYRRAQKLNEVYWFDFVDIDKSIYRMKNNLEPLTNEEQLKLALNLFEVTNTSKEKLYDLYKDIYELFLTLKRNSEYTSDRFINEFQKIKK